MSDAHKPNESSGDNPNAISVDDTDLDTLGADAEDAELLRHGLPQVDAEISALVEKIGSGEEVTAEDVNAARLAIEEIQSPLELGIAKRVDGVEPFEKVVRDIPFGTMGDVLGVDVDDVDVLREHNHN